eukprot:XP_027312540.1 uncharacterized protein LOC113843568 isoform X1 [Anas platyrhynchos]
MQILNYSRERPPPCLFLWGFLWGFLLSSRVTSGLGGGSEPGLAPSPSPASPRGRVPGRSCGAGAVRALRAPARPVPGGAMSRCRRSGDRYRYLVFWQRPMVPLGLLQLALSALCVVSGFVDGVFRTESALGRTRAPVWAGMVMGVPGVLALFSSQRKNPILVNVLIAASIISCVAILIVIAYGSLTLGYGEEEDLSSHPAHVIRTKFVLSKVVKGASITMLVASICSTVVVTIIAYLGCRSLPCCACYDSVTGMEWLQPNEDQNQALEMVCAVQSPGDRIFNFPDRFPVQDVDTEEDTSKPPPYIRMT